MGPAWRLGTIPGEPDDGRGDERALGTMNIVPQVVPSVELAHLSDQARDYARQSMADSTLRAYQID